MPLKILTVIGARPQFIKAAAVSDVIRRYPSLLQESIVHTGQHYDLQMSPVFFDQLRIPEPQYHLGVHDMPHGAMTGTMMIRLEKVMQEVMPDIVLVYGDTNSTLAGALTAAKLNISVAHIEAGLRSFNRSMPEEINRVLTDRLSDVLFCPTDRAKENLVRESFGDPGYMVRVSGDVMLDVLLRFLPAAKPPQEKMPDEYLLATIHRQSNTDHPDTLREIFQALSILADETPVILPIHPRTRAAMRKAGITPAGRIIVIEPVGYLESLWLIEHCRMVLTDSGGLQKEAYFLGKACVTLRDETEWTELTDAGVNITAGTTVKGVLEACRKLLPVQVVPDLSLYGNGKSSEYITDLLLMTEALQKG